MSKFLTLCKKRYTLVVYFSLIYLHLIKKTIRLDTPPHKHWEKGNFIWVFWHNRILLFILFYLKFLRGRKFVALISPSRDGEIIACISEKIGISSVRGSSKHFSPRTAKKILKYLQSGYHLIVIPDGPRGPRYELKEGVLWISAFSRIPVLPLDFSISRYRTIPSWDRFIFPLPFSRESVTVSSPLLVCKETWELTKEKLKEKLGGDIENQK